MPPDLLDRVAATGLPVRPPAAGEPVTGAVGTTTTGATATGTTAVLVVSCDPADGDPAPWLGPAPAPGGVVASDPGRAAPHVPPDAGAVRLPGPVRAALAAAAGQVERLAGRPVQLRCLVDGQHWWIEQVAGAVLTPAARVRSAVRLASGPDPVLRPADALGLVEPADVAHFLHTRIGEPVTTPLVVGTPASPGAASGRVALSAAAAIELADGGDDVVLVRDETAPDDVPGMQVSRGILTARGGLASHAAVVARGWGIPAVVGAAGVRLVDGFVEIGDHRVGEGDEISIDGGTGEVHLGRIEVASDEAPPELDTLLSWADATRLGTVAVRANADTGVDAGTARRLGADGIGLCRTEHMFLAEDRLPLVRAFILSDDPGEQSALLGQLEEAQYRDFSEVLAAMEGLPVTVRLLDPPLHEFLPDAEALAVAAARGELDAEGRTLLRAVRRLHESNPMIGTRGVRLGVVKPGLYPMQVRALCRAVASLRAQGGRPSVEVMIPLVVGVRELQVARSWVEATVAGLREEGLDLPEIPVGAMIETPRAALVAGDLAGVADFFSFGTNDLTQLTFGLSRDDVEAELLPAYLERGLLDANPFDLLDADGVGRLVRTAVDDARHAVPSVTLGACGEQAGSAGSIPFLVASGLDYVSCSPYRVPIARLAVARALLDQGRVDPASVVPPTATEGATEAGTGGAAMVVAGGRPVSRAGGVRPGEHGEPAGGTAPRAGDRDRLVLHVLRIKGLCTAEVVAEVGGLHDGDVHATLASLREQELVRFVESRSFWQLTPTGRERHAAALPGEPPEALDVLHAAYGRFLVLNSAFKTLCTTWQTRDGEVNDHTDAAYDRLRIEELAEVHRDVRPVIEEMAAGVPRFARYGERLGRSLQRVVDGEHRLFTGVMCGSFHDVWMELHEDLVLLLGVDRVAEGSF